MAVKNAAFQRVCFTSRAYVRHVLVVAVVVIIPLPGRAESIVDERVRADPACMLNVERLSAAGKELWRSVSDESARLQRMPTLPEFEKLLEANKMRLGDRDDLYLFGLFGRIQQPPVTRDQLSVLLRAQRSSISSLSTKYVVHFAEGTGGRAAVMKTTPTHEECFFALDGPKVIFRRAQFGCQPGGEIRNILTKTLAYDGHVLRRQTERPGAIPNAFIQTLSHRRLFYADGNPLCSAKLLHSEVDYGYVFKAVDLAAAIDGLFVYESPVEVNGVRCIAVGDVSRQYYCAPEWSYALVQQREGALVYDRRQQKYVRRDTWLEVSNSDFENVAGDVWLPRRSERKHYRDGKLADQFKMTVQAYAVNQPIEPSVFSNIITDGSVVLDAVNGE